MLRLLELGQGHHATSDPAKQVLGETGEIKCAHDQSFRVSVSSPLLGGQDVPEALFYQIDVDRCRFAAFRRVAKEAKPDVHSKQSSSNQSGVAFHVSLSQFAIGTCT